MGRDPPPPSQSRNGCWRSNYCRESQATRLAFLAEPACETCMYRSRAKNLNFSTLRPYRGTFLPILTAGYQYAPQPSPFPPPHLNPCLTVPVPTSSPSTQDFGYPAKCSPPFPSKLTLHPKLHPVHTVPMNNKSWHVPNPQGHACAVPEGINLGANGA